MQDWSNDVRAVRKQRGAEMAREGTEKLGLLVGRN